MKKPLSTYTRVMLDYPKYSPQSNQNIFIKMIYHITVEYKFLMNNISNIAFTYDRHCRALLG